MKLKNTVFMILLMGSLIACKSILKEQEFSFKEQDIELKVWINDDHRLNYQILRSGNAVIDTSQLGIVIDNRLLGFYSEMELLETKNVQLAYPMHGVKEMATYNGTLYRFEITEPDKSKWFVEFQLSQEGAAYRYIIPNEGISRVIEEHSSFKFPAQTKVWFFERNNNWKLRSHAGEWLCADIADMPTVSQMGPVQGLTLTCELPHGGYALLGESALFNYSGMRLKAIGNNTFQANFTEEEKGFQVKGNITTPWRCILLARNLNDLVNNTMVASLNPGPDKRIFKDTDWIKPGKAAWFWWSGETATYADEKETVDNAAKLGFNYTMVDEGWEKWKDKWNTTKSLCEYADKQNVKIFLWKHSREINYPENNWEVMRTFLDHVKQTGAVGVKVDFMNGNHKLLIEFDEALLKYAAERKLMVNFHGCQQSSGEYRTYPNEITREGIRGIELNNLSEGPLPASHNAALPFTRFITGHGDYTPLAFSAPGETTWAHQLATLVCFYSPFQCIAEDPAYLLKEKRILPALELIKKVPSTWDETIVLPDSKIGELAAIARRKGNNWYVGILNTGKSRRVDIKCDFLAQNSYNTEIYTDDLDAELVNIEGINPRANLKKGKFAIPFQREDIVCEEETSLSLELAANGGAVIWFKTK
ncbi:alpha-glucosidase [Puteibacter caeruleilacunae]|nr:alpha-glucosidase [Puteibacter caeruleilacunae]